ncbi:MAG: hypothetical protein GKR94_33090 [Gammaproteobacteria bacterium]|nr:hypothetical protein [Gammaproteobacteria bacterium]
MEGLSSDAKSALGKLSEAIRLRHYSIRAEQVYRGWIRRFLYRARRLDLAALSAWHARRLLPDLVTQWAVALSTRDQALHAVAIHYAQDSQGTPSSPRHWCISEQHLQCSPPCTRYSRAPA